MRTYLVAMISMVAPYAATAQESPTSARPFSRQHLAEKEAWSWNDHDASLATALRDFRSSFEWSLRNIKDDPKWMELTFMENKELRWRLKCHWMTPFIIDNSRLYYVEYAYHAPFGRVVCVDLARAKQMWSCPIGEIVPVWFHSAYLSARAITKRDGHIWVRGKESQGRFLNVIDAETGELVAARLYENERKDAPAKSP